MIQHELCAKCLTNPAKHKQWLKFTNPEPYPDAMKKLAEAAGIAIPIAPVGVWQYVCDDCR